jgi:2-dehydropantoate 2-reductase
MTRIAVFGAGAIGCWVGGRLSTGGAQVTLIVRRRMRDDLAAGVTTTDLDGESALGHPTLAVEPDEVATAVRSANVVLVTVKSPATVTAGNELRPHVSPNTVVVSLQNGVRNAPALRDALGGHPVLAGMVPFNVVARGPGKYHRASEGVVMIENAPGAVPLARAFGSAHLACELRDDMTGVQWAKLVLNLNNAINALCGKPLATELSERDFRRCLALAQREAIEVIRASKQPLARVTVLPTAWIPRLLPAPDLVFRLLARRIIAIDPDARSSLWDDLVAKRATEIDYLQGEIVSLAKQLGRTAPINGRLVELVRAAEAGGKRDYTGAELRAEMHSARTTASARAT